jgi:hypothetical protein
MFLVPHFHFGIHSDFDVAAAVGVTEPVTRIKILVAGKLTSLAVVVVAPE